ncbi:MULTISPECIES: alanine racemase C-terminal domain-containing protein [unclassified Paenibacillus]|uniref:alanine racemase n=1 Tax=unclassified Paenibacillus TaxID=185978 RepID=UPI0009714C1F|nr:MULTISPECIES: alanine racemase C-terminal domain-containing protein [unclassified Paenibacillus]
MISGPAGLGPADVELRPVLSLKASVTRVSRVERGDTVGYNRDFTASRATMLATLSVGYADGIPRRLSETGGSVLLHGKRAPIVGRISMDQMTVDVTNIEGVRQGDAATLIGRDGAEAITACDMAASSGTIVNEVISRLGPRLKRMYRC